jgi:hypothetical protein
MLETLPTFNCAANGRADLTLYVFTGLSGDGELNVAQDNPYEYVIVESFEPERASGLKGKVHIRPAPGGKYPTTLHVECSKKLSKDFPVGTRFKLQAKLTDREDGGEYLYSSFRWPYEVVK